MVGGARRDVRICRLAKKVVSFAIFDQSYYFLDSIASMSAPGCRETSAEKAPSVSRREIIAVALRIPVMAFLGDVARVITKGVFDRNLLARVQKGCLVVGHTGPTRVS